MGCSMKSPMPAKSAIESNFSMISGRLRPSTAPPIRTFSRPVASRSNVAPSASTGATRPFTQISPLVGRVMPQTICRRVDLPQPLRPMMPRLLPRSTSKVMSFRAQNDL